MKYARKTVVIVLVVVFFIALAICAAVGTRIKNINITYSESTGEGYEAYARTYENLQNLKGGNIFLLSNGEVESCVSDGSRLNLVSFKKSFPCTLEIEIQERVETFYSYLDGVCYVYDEEGTLMYSSSNIAGGTEEGGYVVTETDDLSPNVMLEYDLTQAERTFLADSCAVFKQNFGALRGLVKNVYREITIEKTVNLVFVLRSGLEIEISSCDSQLEEKIAKAYSNYLSLSDGQKTSGQIAVYTQDDSEGTIKSVYIP